MELPDRIAIVTGAASGIGRAASLRLGRAGAKLVLVDVNADALAALAQEAGELGIEARTCVADVSLTADVQRYVGESLHAHGRIDVFFNNAGISGSKRDVGDYPIEEFDRIVAVNLRGVFLGLKFVVPHMLAQRSGSVINTSSLAGERGFAQSAAYVACKHAVIGLTRTVAAEAAPHGVRVNAVCPGMVDTPMMRAGFAGRDLERGLAAVAAVVPMARLAQPDEVAAAVQFLASDAASYITGAALGIDGGIHGTVFSGGWQDSG